MENVDTIYVADNIRIYVNYEEVPPHPGCPWTRFVCISDTHSLRTFAVPEGDVLLHAGDLTSFGYPTQLQSTIDWLRRLSHPVKIIIAGNHDLSLDADLPDDEQVLQANDLELLAIRDFMKGRLAHDFGIQYLEHEVTSFKSYSGRIWTVYGSPSAPRYSSGAFQYSTPEEALNIYGRIPSDIDVLITHTPPHGVLDMTRKGLKAGCPHLNQRISDLGRCKLHVFGHIHEARGAMVRENGTVFVNAAMAYHDSQAIIVDLADG